MESSKRVQPISYEETQESLAMRKLVAQSQRSIGAGRYKPLKKAFADLAARTKT
jgi:hypothetical protein